MTRGEVVTDDDRDAWIVSAARFGNREIFICADRECAYALARYLIAEVGVKAAGDNDDFSSLRRKAFEDFDMDLSVECRPVWILKKTPLEELDECCSTDSSLPTRPGHGDRVDHRQQRDEERGRVSRTAGVHGD